MNTNDLNRLFVTEMARMLIDQQQGSAADLFRRRPSDTDLFSEWICRKLITGEVFNYEDKIRTTGEFLLVLFEGRSKWMRLAWRHPSGVVLVRNHEGDYRLWTIVSNPHGKDKLYLNPATLAYPLSLHAIQKELGFRTAVVRGPLREPHISETLFPALLKGI